MCVIYHQSSHVLGEQMFYVYTYKLYIFLQLKIVCTSTNRYIVLAKLTYVFAFI